eukprot:CAMPEP_0177365588 /NCGR_PEP_ID=MMETSP0368-20130122/39406_1 /TAXON_ID=447022 ORGANISM="Scrippsiella hangoei-like, Strain SHHI-4" /NCGR_SAMPLE_ID=MMETSP0368 /ASSEMBLY_ACC=CAM_ASM_000363 /LENGTH=331 /DNA_ID=CAMNT_0018828531 /DNA_START=64 /DNA_END=1059 /DNA_ORIENTATION=+
MSARVTTAIAALTWLFAPSGVLAQQPEPHPKRYGMNTMIIPAYAMKHKCEWLHKAEANKADWLKQQPWYAGMVTKCKGIDASTPDLMEHFPKVGQPNRDDGRDDSSFMVKKCRGLFLAEKTGQQEWWLAQQTWYPDFKAKCAKLLHGEDVMATPPPTKFAAVGEDAMGSSWKQALSGAMLQKKCELLMKAKENGDDRVKALGLESMDWYRKMEAKCAGFANSGSPRMETAPEPEGVGAWTWNDMAGGLNKLFTAKEDDKKDFDIQDIEMLTAEVLMKKCQWLEKMSEKEEGGVEKEEEAIATWAKQQPWFDVLHKKCSELTVTMPDTMIQV